MLSPPDAIIPFAAAGLTLRLLPDGRVGARPKERLTAQLRRTIAEHRRTIIADLIAAETLNELSDSAVWSEPERRAAFDVAFRRRLLDLPDDAIPEDVRAQSWRSVVAVRKQLGDWIPKPHGSHGRHESDEMGGDQSPDGAGDDRENARRQGRQDLGPWFGVDPQ